MHEFLKPLPCPEHLWTAASAELWQSLYEPSPVGCDRLSLSSNLSFVLNKEPIPSCLGGFGRLAMVHAIYQTTFDLRSAYANPLMTDLTGIASNGALTLRNWQTRTVELLESLTPLEAPKTGQLTLLHHSPSWALQSNYMTTVHHVMLLNFTPIGDLFLFVSPSCEQIDRFRAKEILLQWVSQDEGQDARRAVLSACIIFTIIRLRPSQSFHEPIPFFMATIAIWAYNHLVQPDIEATSSTAGNDSFTLRLDQVSTSEEGRIWIQRDPGTVRGYLADVGSVHDHSAGKRLLVVAHQVLTNMHLWGPSRGFAAFLKALLEKHYH